MVLVSSISNFFFNKMFLANKWMRKKIPSFCNLALVVLVCYMVIFKTKNVMKIMTKWTICKLTLWKCICLEIFSKSNHKCLDLYLKMRENNWEQIWLYLFFKVFLHVPESQLFFPIWILIFLIYLIREISVSKIVLAFHYSKKLF